MTMTTTTPITEHYDNPKNVSGTLSATALASTKYFDSKSKKKQTQKEFKFFTRY